jgi:hypothetical protein
LLMPGRAMGQGVAGVESEKATEWGDRS